MVKQPKKSTPSTSANNPSSSSAAIQERIASLESSLLANTSNPNPLLPLLSFARHPQPDITHRAIWALHRVFIALINERRVGLISGTLTRASIKQGGEGEGGDVKGWNRARLFEYIEVLSSLLRDSEDALRSSALQLLFALLPPLSTPSPIPYFRLILTALLHPTPSLRGAKFEPQTSTTVPTPSNAVQHDSQEGTLPLDVAAMVVDEYWAKYDDIRLFFFREAAAHVPLDKPDNLMNQLVYLTNLPRVQDDLNAFFIPSLSTPPPSSEATTTKKSKQSKSKSATTGTDIDSLPSWMESYESDHSDTDETTIIKGKRQRVSAMGTRAAVHSVPAHVAAYTTLWEAVLAHSLDAKWTRTILIGLHGSKGILSHFRPERRVRVADWLTEIVDRGGPMALLAMNGLFVLMTQYNLDYPNFYTRLYNLLDADLLHVKYRARFFRLLDTFLRSSLLPAALIAAFVKRLARLSLTAPPGGIILVIPFIYNLLKRHPSCMILLHNPSSNTPLETTTDSSTTSPSRASSEYDPLAIAPLDANALSTHISAQLHELASLQSHVLAPIATMSKIFTEQFTKPEYNMEDFLDHGYSTLFNTEIERLKKMKRDPAVSNAVEGLGLSNEVGKLFDAQDVVTELWKL